MVSTVHFVLKQRLVIVFTFKRRIYFIVLFLLFLGWHIFFCCFHTVTNLEIFCVLQMNDKLHFCEKVPTRWRSAQEQQNLSQCLQDYLQSLFYKASFVQVCYLSQEQQLDNAL